MADHKKKSKPFWLVAGLLAWLIPGAGHVYLGRTRRGVILFVTITATFWAGVAMGGVMTVDSKYEPWWFAAQMLTGVNGGGGWYRQNEVYNALRNDEDVQREAVGMYEQVVENYRRAGKSLPKSWNGKDPLDIVISLSDRPDRLQMLIDWKLQQDGVAVANPTDGVARAYSGVAGMLNLLCVFDVIMLAMIGRHRILREETSGGSAK